MSTLATKAKTKNLNIRISSAEYDAIKNIARFNGQTMSAFVLNLVYDYLDDLEDVKSIEEYEKAKEHGSVKHYTMDEIIAKHEIDV